MDLNKTQRVITLHSYLILVIAVMLTIIPLPRLTKYNKWFYRRYLLSKRWRKLRIKRYKMDKGKCQGCKKALRLDEFECHHKTYKRLGNERLSDIQTMCKICHRKIDHRKIK